MSRNLVRSLVSAAVLCAGVGVFPTLAFANLDGTWSITHDNFGIDCTAGCGTVTISNDGTKDVTFVIDITTSTLDIHGIGESFAFDVTGTGISVGITGANGTVWSTTLETSGVGQQDGLGNFTDAVNCNGAISGNLCGTKVTIDLTSASNISLALNNDSNPFSLKLSTNGDNKTTGFSTGTLVTAVPGPVAGAGLPGLIAACGGLIALARRRRRSQTVA